MDVDADVMDAVQTQTQGMEIATAECDKAAAAVELFVRSSIALPRRPVVLIMDAQVDQASKLPLKRMHGRNQRWVSQGYDSVFLSLQYLFGLETWFLWYAPRCIEYRV